MQALGEKYGLLPGYEEEGKKTTREPKHKGVGKKTLPLQPEQTEVKALLLNPCGRQTDNCVAMPIRIRISIFDVDPDLDPELHQNNADPHVDPTPSLTHVGQI